MDKVSDFFKPEDFWPGKEGEGPVSKAIMAGMREKFAADANIKIAPLFAELEELRVLAKDHLRATLDMNTTFDEIDRIKAAAIKYGWGWEPERIDPESPWRQLALENNRLQKQVSDITSMWTEACAELVALKAELNKPPVITSGRLI